MHFDQYMKWKKDKHSKAFDLLTVKYEKDVKCLKCHTTGYGGDGLQRQNLDGLVDGRHL